MAHDHPAPTHAHGSAWRAAPHVRRITHTVVVILLVATLVGVVAWWPRGDADVDSSVLGFSDQWSALVTAADVADCAFDPTSPCIVVRVRLDSGPDKGTSGAFEVSAIANASAGTLDAGDRIIVYDLGEEVPTGQRYGFADYQRRSPLIWLALLFAASVVALGRLRGLLALAGLVLSLGVLLVYVLPALLRDAPPVGVAVTGAAVIAFVALYLAHGVNDGTTIALLGTFAALTVTATLGSAFASLANLTGLATEESINLLAFAPSLDFRGLLLAAVIIGSLGVLDDVTVTQVSAVSELHHANPSLSARGLYRAAIRIGRDHIASTVNTLVLAYTAAALPLLLIFTQSGLSLGTVANSETVAVEIVQTLVGSIGLVASVPITTALAVWAITSGARDAGLVQGSAPRASSPRT